MPSRYAAAYTSPRGPGDARPTALQIIRDEDLENALPHKTILITGCTSGLGVATAHALAATGATLYLTGRDLSKGAAALGTLLDSPRVHLLALDLSSQASVRAFAADFLQRARRLDVLVCNAGVMALPESRTADGVETQFATNHLGHFLLANLLKPALVAAAPARVVVLSSAGHRRGGVVFENINFEGEYDPMRAYAQSKTANIYMANALTRRWGGAGVVANSVHPGRVRTGLSRGMSLGSMLRGMGWEPWRMARAFMSAEQGAATTVWAAVGRELEGVGGRYLEDCEVVGEWDGRSMLGRGYASHAFDREKEERLWRLSAEMVGVEDEGEDEG